MYIHGRIERSMMVNGLRVSNRAMVFVEVFTKTLRLASGLNLKPTGMVNIHRKTVTVIWVSGIWRRSIEQELKFL